MEANTKTTEEIKMQGYNACFEYTQPLRRDEEGDTLQSMPSDERSIRFSLTFADDTKLSVAGEYWRLRTLAEELTTPTPGKPSEISLGGKYRVQLSREVAVGRGFVSEAERENTHTSIKITFADDVSIALAAEAWKVEAFGRELTELMIAIA